MSNHQRVTTSLLWLTLTAAAVEGGEVTLTARLDGAQVVPAVPTVATGRATFDFDEDSLLLSGSVEVDGMSGSHAGVYVDAPGTPGQLLFPLSGGPVAFSGQAVLPSELQDSALDGGLFVRVASKKHPGGELRGALTLRAFGLPHVAVGAAHLTLDGSLRVEGLGVSGDAGYDVELPDVDGVGWTLEPISATGETRTFEVFGSGAKSGGASLGSQIRKVVSGGIVATTFDLAAIGAAHVEVRASSGTGKTLAAEVIANGLAFIGPEGLGVKGAAMDCRIVSDGKGSTLEWVIQPEKPYPWIKLATGAVVESVHHVTIHAVDPSWPTGIPTSISRLSVRASAALDDAMVVVDTNVTIGGKTHRALGRALLDVSADGIAVRPHDPSEPKSSTDGVEVGLPIASASPVITEVAFSAQGAEKPGAGIAVSLVGPGVPGPTSLTVAQVEDPVGGLISGYFTEVSGLGSEDYVQVWWKKQEVVSLPHGGGTTSTSWPTSVTFGTDAGTYVIRAQFADGAFVSVGGKTVLADEIRFIKSLPEWLHPQPVQARADCYGVEALTIVHENIEHTQ